MKIEKIITMAEKYQYVTDSEEEEEKQYKMKKI